MGFSVWCNMPLYFPKEMNKDMHIHIQNLTARQSLSVWSSRLSFDFRISVWSHLARHVYMKWNHFRTKEGTPEKENANFLKWKLSLKKYLKLPLKKLKFKFKKLCCFWVYFFLFSFLQSTAYIIYLFDWYFSQIQLEFQMNCYIYWTPLMFL